MEGVEKEGNENISVLAEELINVKQEFNSQWSWHKLVKDVSDYTHTSFFNLMEKSVLEVLAIAQMMIEEGELNQMQTNNTQN